MFISTSSPRRDRKNVSRVHWVTRTARKQDSRDNFDESRMRACLFVCWPRSTIARTAKRL